MQLFMKLLNTFFGTARLDAHRENARGIAKTRAASHCRAAAEFRFALVC